MDAIAIQIIRNDAISQVPAEYKASLQDLITPPLAFTAGRGGAGGRGAGVVHDADATAAARHAAARATDREGRAVTTPSA